MLKYRMLVAVGELVVSVISARGIVQDSLSKSQLRYGEPVFSSIMDGYETYAYKVEGLYVTQTFNENQVCEKAEYRRQDKRNMMQDDFELIFRGEEAQAGEPLTLSTPALRFLEFENNKVARVDLESVTFFSKGEFTRTYGETETRKAAEERARLDAQQAAHLAPTKRVAAPSVKKRIVRIVKKPAQAQSVDAVAPVRDADSSGSSVLTGFLIGLLFAVVGYFMWSRAMHKEQHTQKDELDKMVELAPKRVMPEPVEPVASAASTVSAPHSASKLVLKRKR